jgi:hypothetical protein
MSGILHCPGCGVEITTADMDLAVPTDEGVYHGTCFEGDVPSVTIIEWKDGSDIPEEVAGRQLERYEALFGPFPCTPFTIARPPGRSGVKASGPMEFDTYDKSERLADEMESIERQMGGRYDEDGYGF